MAKSNYQSTETVHAKRGTIYDRTGAAIAVDSSTYTIYAVIDKTQVDSNGNPLYIDKKDFTKVEDFLNSKLGIDRDLIKKQLNSKLKQVQFGPKGSDISLEKMKEIQKRLRMKNCWTWFHGKYFSFLSFWKFCFSIYWYCSS